MVKTRIIPVLLHRGKTLVKGKQFHSWRSVGSAVQAAMLHNARNVDELIMLDTSATPEHREPDAAMVRELSDNCFMPLTIGGGIKNLDHVHALFDAGADKVCLGTAAVINRFLIDKIAKRYGQQAVVVSVDVDGNGEVCYFSGMMRHKVKPEAYAHAVVQAGAGEILLQSIPRDGMMGGYDCELVRRVASEVSVPVVASCGAGEPEHCAEVLRAGAHAVAAGAMFQWTEHTPASVAEYLAANGFMVRVAA